MQFAGVAGTKHNSERNDWGFLNFLDRDELTIDRGFLAPDGSLVLHLELEIRNPKPPNCLRSHLAAHAWRPSSWPY